MYRIRTLVDVLQTATATVLHADPELVPAQIRAEVGDNVGVAAIAHHYDLLLDDLDVIALLQLNHLYGGQIIALDDLGLRAGEERHESSGLISHRWIPRRLFCYLCLNIFFQILNTVTNQFLIYCFIRIA